MQLHSGQGVLPGLQHRLIYVASSAIGLALMISLLVMAAGKSIKYIEFELSVWLVSALLLRFLTRRRVWSLLFAGLLSLSIAGVSILKQQYLDTKLIPSDLLLVVDDPFLVASFSSPVIVASAAAIVLVLVLAYAMEKSADRIRWWELAVLAVTSAYVIYFLHTPLRVWKGNVTVTTRNLTQFIGAAIYPVQLDLERCKDLGSLYCGNMDVADLARGLQYGDKPNIIVISLESTFDLRSIAGVQGPKLGWRGFQGSRSLSFTRGGGTWIQEIAALHGVAPPNYGPGYPAINRLAPAVLKGRIAPLLASMGYDTTAIASARRDHYNADRYYPAMGIKTIFGCQDMNTCQSSRRDIDKGVFAKITEVIAHSTAPQFIFANTFTNHSPHRFAGGERLITCRPPITQDGCDVLNEYYQRELLVQDDMRNLVNGLQSLQRRTVVLAYGDHIPADVYRNFPITAFQKGDGLHTLFFLYDTAKNDFLTPHIKEDHCAGAPSPGDEATTAAFDAGPVYSSADFDAIVLNEAGILSDYVRQKLAKLQREDCETPVGVLKIEASPFFKIIM